ncbi:hypothetical protein G9C85_16080 [Halorubellus sp. JP-L1]|uniref:HTH domain-containing protein n=1 Tax=Halorubellus sp. JP-L1 TaxID=2715753 RepID=UPI00140AE660|nr:HTH domain-containing protein [Halorubellus sp. JP-L1]NHN43137.1 hypothetical protein [Halorubellus sp. JP-L1]
MPLTDSTLAADGTVHVDLYHCASMYGTHEQQRTVIDRLESLAEANAIDSVDRHAWARTLSPDAADDWCREARSKYGRFWAWAREHDRTLEPAFGTRTVGSMISDDTHEVIEFPVLCLAVYVDDALVHVAPSTDATTGETATVADSLAELEETANVQHAHART